MKCAPKFVAFFAGLFWTAFTSAAESTDLPGRYYCGDHTGYNIYLNLSDTGKYDAIWEGCLGRYGTAKGTWRATGDQIALTPKKETDMMKQHLTRLIVIRDTNGVSLVRQESEKDKDNPFFRFTKKSK